jgi:hypothetical protein
VPAIEAFPSHDQVMPTSVSIQWTYLGGLPSSELDRGPEGKRSSLYILYINAVHLHVPFPGISHATHEPFANYSDRLGDNTGQSDDSTIISRSYLAPTLMLFRNQSPQDSLPRSAVGLLHFNKSIVLNQLPNNPKT